MASNFCGGIVSDITLDMFEYSSDAAAQAAYVTNAAGTINISNADIDDEVFTSITAWEDWSYVGLVSQVTFDSKSCIKLDSNTPKPGVGRVRQDLGTFGSRIVFSMSLYCASLGVGGSDDTFTFWASNATTDLHIQLASNGVFVYDGATWIKVVTNEVTINTWQEWTFDVNWTAQTVDIYLDKVLKASGADCSVTGSWANGYSAFGQYGWTVANRISYMDWFKAGSAFAIVTPSLQSYSESTIKTQGSYSLKGIAGLTISLNGTLTRNI
jgi:hypothetical protein